MSSYVGFGSAVLLRALALAAGGGSLWIISVSSSPLVNEYMTFGSVM